MTLDLEKMAREFLETELAEFVIADAEPALVKFARSVQKATEEHWIAVVDAEHKEWAAQLEGEPVNVWEALDNVRQAGLRLLAEEEG